MDRSYLFDARVVEASRNFVCIRLATYEDAAEAAFMKSLYLGRSGQMENTTFAILAPDGRQKLSSVGRGPFHAFRNAREMATGMARIASKYTGGDSRGFVSQRLPEVADLELALNVSSADGLPLIVAVADTLDRLDEIHAQVLPHASSAELAGQFTYVSVLDRSDLKPLTGVTIDTGIVVVEPGPFGLSGKTLAQFDRHVSADKVKSELQRIVAEFERRDKDHDSHVQLGIQLGIDWESKIPETDQQSIRAKRRVRGGR